MRARTVIKLKFYVSRKNKLLIELGGFQNV